MNFCIPAVLLPLLSAPLIGLLRPPSARAIVHLVVSAVVLLLTIAVCTSPGTGPIHADALGMVFGLLTSFVSLSAAISQLNTPIARTNHAIWQIVLGATLLGLYADNIILLWAGAAAAALAATLRAGWPALLLASLGAALVLFGTLLVYLTAQPSLGTSAMSLAALAPNAATLGGSALTLAFVFLLFGFGIQAALSRYAPAALSGLMLNLPLLAILRFSHLPQANPNAMPPGPLLLTLGLAALFYAAFSFSRMRDSRNLFGLSGLALFAFGLGGTTAIFGSLLQLLLLTLVQSALGNARPSGWPRAACLFALTALPPSGLFAAAFIISSQTIQRAPWLAVPLGLGLAACLIAMLRAIGPLPFGRLKTSLHGSLAALHLALAFGIAFAMPAQLFRLLSSAAQGLQ